MPRVYLSVGSNIDRQRHIASGLQALRQQFGQIVVSPLYESVAVGFVGQPFYNLAVGLDTVLTVADLAKQLRQIEADHGRLPNLSKYSDRTLDIDILTYGDAVGCIDGVQLPRDELDHQVFVIVPLADIAPNACHPRTRATYASMAKALGDVSQLLWPQPPG